MPDKTLSILVGLIIVLIFGHDIDHVIRGDFAEPVPTLIVTAAKYAALVVGLFLYVTRRIGPGFWAILAGFGVVLAWLAHFSPFSDQTPQFIYRAYESPGAGAFAVTLLAALMLVLVATTLYATVLWARTSK